MIHLSRLLLPCGSFDGTCVSVVETNHLFRADTDESYKEDKDAIVQNYPKYADQVYAVTVGSESLYRGNFTGDQLLEKIKDVKKSLPKAKVGTADSWNKYQDGTADPVVKGADIM